MEKHITIMFISPRLSLTETFLCFRLKMQKLRVVLVIFVVALSLVSAEEAKYKRLVHVNPEFKRLVSVNPDFRRLVSANPEPYCSGWEIAWCAEEVAGNNRVKTQNFFFHFCKNEKFRTVMYKEFL